MTLQDQIAKSKYRVVALCVRKPEFTRHRTGRVYWGNVLFTFRKAVNMFRRLNLSDPNFLHYPLKTDRRSGDHVR